MLNYILLIDNYDSNHLLFQRAIQKIDLRCRLVGAKAGKEGIRIFSKINPYLVLINFQLQDMTGLDCLKKIKSIKRNEHIPIYLYNNIITQPLAAAATEFGAKNCFTFSDEDHTLPQYLGKILNENKVITVR